MNRPLVYLSGPIAGLNYEGATDWREYARRYLYDLDIEGLSPMRGKEFLKGRGIIRDRMSATMERAISEDRAIVARDRWDTQRCDFMLCNLLGAERVSIGTMIELGWADATRVPVVLVMEAAGNPHDHAFVRQLAGYWTDTLDEGLDIVASALGFIPPAPYGVASEPYPKPVSPISGEMAVKQAVLA